MRAVQLGNFVQEREDTDVENNKNEKEKVFVNSNCLPLYVSLNFHSLKNVLNILDKFNFRLPLCEQTYFRQETHVHRNN